MNVLASKTAGNEPIINYGSIGGWNRFLKVGDCRAPDIEGLCRIFDSIDQGSFISALASSQDMLYKGCTNNNINFSFLIKIFLMNKKLDLICF